MRIGESAIKKSMDKIFLCLKVIAVKGEFVIFQLKTVETFKHKNILSVDFFIVDSPIQCASFYVERIDLGLHLRKFLPKWRWSRPFSGKESQHKFSDIDPSNLIICWFTHFQQPYSLKH